MGSAKTGKARLNLRLFLFCACGLIFGILLYCRCRFGGLVASDFLIFVTLLLAAYFPVSLKRVLCVTLPFLIFAGAGVSAIHLHTQKFLSGPAAGEYAVAGTVASFSVGNGYSEAELISLSFDGEEQGGRMVVTVESEEVRAGDRISFTARVSRMPLPQGSNLSFDYLDGILFRAAASSLEGRAKSDNLFLRLNGAIYDVLHENMARDEADVCYALLTGNASVLDSSLADAVRRGGIAHVFAVSGLHIGILYAAVSFLFRFLRRLRFLPATAVSAMYGAVCGFSVSAVRAIVMCAALGLSNALGRKSDFLHSVAFAATAVLLFAPAQWFAAGFRLSFGACLGLALFSGTLSRGMKKLPAFLKNYLSATISVQTLTFPVLLDSFGYLSVWGTLLNFVLIPALPVLFLASLCCSLFALIVPPAAAVLAVPAGMVSVLLFVLSAADLSFVITGFCLGAGGTVYLLLCIVLSERVRLSPVVRGVTAGVLCLVFAFACVVENVVFTGCKISVSGDTALVRTPTEQVLILGGNATLYACRNFLARNYGGTLTAVIVTGRDELEGINVAAFLDAERIYAREEIPTGLRETEVVFAESFKVGELSFRYESARKLTLVIESLVTEFDFAGMPALAVDLFVTNVGGDLIFYLRNGIIYAR